MGGRTIRKKRWLRQSEKVASAVDIGTRLLPLFLRLTQRNIYVGLKVSAPGASNRVETIMTMEDIRYVDLMPHVPMGDDSNVLEVYADSIADLKLHGSNFTATYFVWGRKGPRGLVQRIPVVKIIRPCGSVFGMCATLATILKSSPSIVRQ